MRIAKTWVRECSCGTLKVRFFGRSRVIVEDGWIRLGQHAVCINLECQEWIRIGPRVDLAFEGEVFSIGQS